ncbi:TonB-dependent receptor [Agaribacter marinus]|uniref:TonB-dependent receptor n=1 Tax=Agaribacter marinus TaxID=1431249 RepID=A0AA37SYM4_9ALTE|nr:TonB-dependent receptor [Agaribacter marinus]GLR70644.1 TonB-dependent receptor [Agaribacter marinus]
MKKSIIALSVVSVLAAKTTLSIADDETAVERIKVTASLVERDLSELPSSVIVLDNDVLEERESRHLQDIISALPNVNFSAGATRGKFIQIRGIGERGQFSEPTNPSVGLLLDEIDISGLGSLATTFDLQQVELLSGPQSVASGVNSLAGVVKLVSQPANGDSAGFATATVAEFGEWQLGAAHGNAISEDLSYRASVQKTSSDGFVENDFLGRDDTNGVDELSASLFLNWNTSEDSSLDFRFYHFNINNGYDAFTLNNDNVTLSDEPGRDHTDANAVSVKFVKEFDAMQLQASVTNLSGEFDYAYDEDWTFTGIHPDGYTSFDRYVRDVNRASLDIKLGSLWSTENNWLVGLNVYNNDESLLREYTFNSGDFTSDYNPESAAVFGQYSALVGENFRLTGSARIESFTADYSDSDGFTETLDDTLFAAAISLEYTLQNSLVYSTLSRGYKAGGFNIDQRLSGNDRTFDPEFNWNVEFGVKGQAFDGMANISASVFYMKREDAQVSDFAVFQNVLDDGTSVPSFADAVRNTDTGKNRGIELSSDWYLSDAWTVKANVGFLRATFGNYTRLDGSFVPEQEQAQAPKFTAFVSSNYLISEQLSWYLDVDAKDEYRLSIGHDERSPFNYVVNSRLSYTIGSSEVSLWVKNLFDRELFTRGFGGFGNDPRKDYVTEPYFQFGQERQIGASYRYSF